MVKRRFLCNNIIYQLQKYIFFLNNFVFFLDDDEWRSAAGILLIAY